MVQKIERYVGAVGAVVYLSIFFHTPSFPTPDKILIFAVLVAMIFGQARALLKRFVPFVALLLVYESFRGLVPHLNNHVNFWLLPAADRFLFLGHLPTVLLQGWLWHGQVMWYDFVFYVAYMLHFVLPFALAVLIWKTRESQYWRYVTSFLIVSFSGFITFLVFPAAPPWMAAERGLIEPITRVSSHVWYALGIHDFPSLYNKISPNPVAAMPSLHAAYALLFALYVTVLFTTRWRWFAWLYPVLIWVGTTYQGEHYVIDVIVGIFYALLSYWVAPYALDAMVNVWHNIRKRLFGNKQKHAKVKTH